MGTQRILVAIVLIGVVGGGFLLLRGNSKSATAKLHISTWSNYYPEDLIEEFTDKTGIKVELSYISSNEELFSKLRAGATGYDIIQPSDYMVRQMAKLGMLAELDHTQLPHLSHLDPFFAKPSYDPTLKHSVPFTWGTTGITVNTEKIKVSENDLSWRLLIDSPDPRHTSLLDDMREVFASVFFLQGISPNTTDLNAMKAAIQTLTILKPKLLTFSGEPRPLVMGREVYIAHSYSTDGVQMAVDDPKLKFFIPKEGAIVWTDNFAIPSTSREPALAHRFIDYFLDPENALKISTQNLLATPNATVKEALPETLRNNPNIYPSPETMKKLHWLEDIGDNLRKMNELWTKLKS